MAKSPPKLPFEDTKMAIFLRKKIDELSVMKTQREIAAEIGYDKPNILSMFKRGEAKVPLDRVGAFARALDVNPEFLLRLALEQYGGGEGSPFAAEIFKNHVSSPEFEVIQFLRKDIVDDTDELTLDRIHEVLPTPGEREALTLLRKIMDKDVTIDGLRSIIKPSILNGTGRDA